MSFYQDQEPGRYLAYVTSPAAAATPGPTVGDVLDAYLAYLAGRPAHRAVESAVRRHLRPALGLVPAAALDRLRLDQLVTRLDAAGKRRLAGMCIATLRAAYNRARLAGSVPRGLDPTLGMRAHQGGRRRRVAGRDELARLVRALDQAALRPDAWPPAVAFYRLLILTGARPSELRRARWSDLDAAARVIRLGRHKTAAQTGEPREIHLSPAALAVLLAVRRLPQEPFLLPDQQGGMLREPTGLWRRVCADAAIAGLAPYDLRRTFASLALRRGWSLDMIGQALGHRHASTTRRYAWLEPKAAAELAGDVARSIGDRPIRQRQKASR